MQIHGFMEIVTTAGYPMLNLKLLPGLGESESLMKNMRFQIWRNEKIMKYLLIKLGKQVVYVFQLCQ